MRKLIYSLFILLVLPGSSGFAQSIKASAKLDTNAMLIGDQVNMSITFSHPLNTMVRWPMIGDTILQKIQVITRSKIDTSFSADKKTVTLKQNFLITSFDSGFYAIPSIRIFFKELPDTTIRYVQTEPLLLSVHTLAVDTTKVIKPIKGPLSVPLTFREILPWLMLAVLVILVILGILYYLKKRKKAGPVFTLKPRIQRSPQEIALSELENLRLKKLWQAGRIKEYHSDLTDILRRYMENRFGIMAMEMTSQEIMEALSTLNELKNDSFTNLNHILAMADLVKFAKMQPLPAEHELSFQNSVAFIHDTAVKKDQIVPND